MESKRVATLTLDDGRSVELPILSGTLGADVLDIHNITTHAKVVNNTGQTNRTAHHLMLSSNGMSLLKVCKNLITPCRCHSFISFLPA